MRILLIDAAAYLLDFALRCEAQGHEVRMFTGREADGSRNPIGRGLITLIDDFHSSMKWADFIMCSDNVKHMRALDQYRKRGFPLWACSSECAMWELDRGAGQRVLEDHGIECLPSTVFSNYDDAIAHQLKNKSIRYVSKPMGDADKALSYVSKSHKDMLFMLDYWKRTQKKKAPFLLQEFAPGIEFAVGGWVGRNGFASYFLENFEFKKLMPGELGVNTGEMGTVMKYVTAEESKLAREMLLPLEAQLIREGYTGYVDVSVIIKKGDGKAGPMEFTMRNGYPLFNIQQVLHPDVVGWMKDSLDGRDTFKPFLDVAVGIVVAIPDFPYGKLPRSAVTGFPVWGITDKNRYNIHPCELMLGEGPGESGRKEPMMVSAGNYLLVVSGTGRSVSKARDHAYSNLKGLEVPNSPIYRNDIGGRLEKQLPLLQKHGYATAWEW